MLHFNHKGKIWSHIATQDNWEIIYQIKGKGFSFLDIFNFYLLPGVIVTLPLSAGSRSLPDVSKLRPINKMCQNFASIWMTPAKIKIKTSKLLIIWPKQVQYNAMYIFYWHSTQIIGRSIVRACNYKHINWQP